MPVTYYVDPINGNDLNSGMGVNDAWKTLTQASKSYIADISEVGFYNARDRLLLKRGVKHIGVLDLTGQSSSGQIDVATIDDHFYVGAYGDLNGDTNAKPIIDPEDYYAVGITIVDTAGITIEGLEIRHVGTGISYRGFLNPNAFGILIRDNEVHNIGGDAINVGASNDISITASVVNANLYVITENLVYDCHNDGISTTDQADGDLRWWITKNVIHGCGFGGGAPRAAGEYSGDGITCHGNSSGLIITDNIISQCVDGIHCINRGDGLPNLIARNHIFECLEHAIFIGNNLTSYVANAATNVSSAAADNSFNLPTGMMLSWAYTPVAGEEILVSGSVASSGNNNGIATVVSATDEKIVVSGVTLVNETAGPAITIGLTFNYGTWQIRSNVLHVMATDEAQAVIGLGTGVSGALHTFDVELSNNTIRLDGAALASAPVIDIETRDDNSAVVTSKNNLIVSDDPASGPFVNVVTNSGTPTLSFDYDVFSGDDDDAFNVDASASNLAGFSLDGGNCSVVLGIQFQQEFPTDDPASMSIVHPRSLLTAGTNLGSDFLYDLNARNRRSSGSWAVGAVEDSVAFTEDEAPVASREITLLQNAAYDLVAPFPVSRLEVTYSGVAANARLRVKVTDENDVRSTFTDEDLARSVYLSTGGNFSAVPITIPIDPVASRLSLVADQNATLLVNFVR